MTSNAKTFSTAQLHCTEKTLLLELDPPAKLPVDVQSPAPAPVMRGELAMECTDPKCLPGHDPSMVVPDPQNIAARVIPPFQYDLPVLITQGWVLAATDAMGTIPLPVLDGSYELCKDGECDLTICKRPPCKGPCENLFAWRVALRLPEKTRFYVYKIQDVSDELASLRDKLIAIPVPLGQPENSAKTAPVDSPT
ncbi:MAG TPA: hypothetical protein VF516_09235 [Kofleriaceae bacterium]